MSSEAEAGEGAVGDERKSREVRLGLVMYGGVSLAIYINGVSAELFRAVRGRGAYRLLKALTDSDIVVDVLSGSSAGGVNGILLAYALCNEREFDAAAELWRQRGDIGGLLRELDAPLASYQSLFDSERKYEPWLHAAFDAIGASPLTADVAEDPSATEELDLFVTGTDFYGRKWATVDDRGSVVQVKDHRAVFWLKHRKGRKEPFARNAGPLDQPQDPGPPTTHAALARLARITSCFPAAFAPVTVAAGEPLGDRLRRWGAIPSCNGARVFIDGGVLDNKPFSTTIDAIYSRLTARPVSRWLLYVEPDPERFAPDAPVPETPNVVRTALAALTALPGYESIADDLRSLRRHNQQTERFASIRTAVTAGAPSTARGESRDYERYRLLGLADELMHPLFAHEMDAGSRRRPTEERRIFDAQAVLRRWFNEHVVDAGGALSQRYRELDVLFFLRRLFSLTYTNAAELYAQPAIARALNRRIEMLEILRAAMTKAVADVARDTFASLEHAPSVVLDEAWAEHVWGQVLAALGRVARVPDPGEHTDLKEFSQRLARPELEPTGSFFETEAAHERALFAASPTLRAAYDDYERLDRELYPIAVVAGLETHDIVRVARVSPLDAQLGLSRADMQQKLTGLDFGHFAAFFKRSWRSNDILWGRLDGACELVDLLLEPPRIEALFASDDTSLDRGTRERARVRLVRVIDTLERDASALPLPAADRRALFAWLRRLASSAPSERKQALLELTRSKKERGAFAGPLHWLVLGAQLEILPAGLSDVLRDAEGERLEETRPTAGVLNDADARLYADETVKKLAVTPQELVRFFEKDYRVGEEGLSNIPALVMLDRLTRGLLVARNSLVASMGIRASRVEQSPVYRIFLGYPLSALAALGAMLRRAPGSLVAFTVASVLYMALSALVLVLWNPLGDDASYPVMAAVLFVGLPLALALVLWFLVRVRTGVGRFAEVARGLGVVLTVALVLGCVPIIAGILRQNPSGACVAWLGAERAALCAPWNEPAVSFLRWLVVSASVLGLCWMLGAFGWLARFFGTRSR